MRANTTSRPELAQDHLGALHLLQPPDAGALRFLLRGDTTALLHRVLLVLRLDTTASSSFGTRHIPASIDHENNFEGVILAVAKPGTSYGEGTCTTQQGCLIALITEARSRFSSTAIRPRSQISDGSANIDANVDSVHALTIGYNNGLGGRHPRVYVEAKGHGVYACGDGSKSSCNGAPGGNGIVYTHGSNDAVDAPNPSYGGSGNYTNPYAYAWVATSANSQAAFTPCAATSGGKSDSDRWRSDTPSGHLFSARPAELWAGSPSCPWSHMCDTR